MAEIIGLVASIIGVTQLTGKLAFVGYNYIGSVKDAPKEIKQLADELSSFKTVLDDLHQYAKDNALSPAIEILSNLDGPLQKCTQHLQALQSKLSKLESREKGWKTLWRNIKWPLKKAETFEIISLLERQKTCLNTAISTHQLTLTQAVNTTVQQTHVLVEDIQNDTGALKTLKQQEEILRIDSTRKTILDWLYPEEYDVKHLKIRGERQENTGKWLLKSQELRDWGKDRNSRLLWGHGIPGAGKTFLSSLVIDDREAQALNTGYGVAYIYFDFKERSQQNATQILASLVKQLAYQLLQLPTEIKALYDRSSPQNKKPTPEDLYKALLVTFGSFPDIYLIFDALDECDPEELRKKLLPLFHRMAGDGANLFMTSRPHPMDIQESFKNVPKITLFAQDEDIETYVQKRIDENPTARNLIRKGNCEGKIVPKLIDCANGMFLLVRFHIDYICQQTNANQILNILNQLEHSSSDLDATYDRVMETIRRQPKNRTELALRVLTWIVKAREPLTVDQIQVAVSVEQKRYELDDLDLPDGQMLLDVCASLVMIDSGKVRLAHYTVQEYILAKTILPDDADFKVAMACITYLSFDKIVQVSERPHLPFFDYAAFNLSFHLHACDEDLSMDMVLYFISRSESVAAYLEALQTDTRLMDNDTWHFDPNTLQNASILGNSAVILFLLEQGADILATDSKGYTALHLAAGYGNEAAVQLLIEKGSVISAKNIDGWTALHVASYRQDGHGPVVKLLLEHGADISTTTCFNETALHLAGDCGNETVVRTLLEWHGCDISAVDSRGNTVLHNAAWSKGITKLLLGNGAHISASNSEGQTALHGATEIGAIDVVEFLFEKGADIATTDNTGQTALHIAAKKGHEAVVELLLEKGTITETFGHTRIPLLDARNHSAQTALHLAAENGHEPIISLLLDKGADITAIMNRRLTAFHLAANGGHKVVVSLLLDKGADTTAITDSRWTALHLAAQNGHEAVVSLLLDKGADIAAIIEAGHTALHIAAHNGHEVVVSLLLDKGADITAITNHRWTALHLAAKSGHKVVVSLLLDKGADTTAITDHRSTALHLAAQNGHEVVVSLLLDKGADIAAVGRLGMTALHLAAQDGHEVVVSLLLHKGADIAAVGRLDMTALQVAKVHGCKGVVKLSKDNNIDLL